MKNITFSASLMCGNLLNLSEDIEILTRHDIDYFHLDVMDGHFVPNITFGFDLVNAIEHPKDIHLMVKNVRQAVPKLQLSKRDMVTFHIEAAGTVDAIHTIRAKGARIGIAINPTTPLDAILPYINDIDHVLVMTVEPGFAGSPFTPVSIEKIRQLSKLIDGIDREVSIGVDGAIGYQEIQDLGHLGANHFVLGTTSLFKDDLSERARRISKLKQELGVTV